MVRFFFFSSLQSKYLLLEFIVYLFLLCNGPYCLGRLPLQSHFFPSYCSVDGNCWCFPLLESHLIKSSLSQIAISKTRHSAADEAFPKLCEKQIWCSMSCRLQTHSGISVQLPSFLQQMILLNFIQHWSNSDPFPRFFPPDLWSQLFSHPVICDHIIFHISPLDCIVSFYLFLLLKQFWVLILFSCILVSTSSFKWVYPKVISRLSIPLCLTIYSIVNYL